jgi:hypothetical protein
VYARTKDGAGGVTRPIDDGAVDATPIEAGRTFAVAEAVREARAAERAPKPAWMDPTDELDPRLWPNVQETYANDANFRTWLETEATPEQVAKITQISTEQERNKAQLAEMDRRTPRWRDEIESLVAWLKRTQGLTDEDVRQFMRNPDARAYAKWTELWRSAERKDAFARSRRTGHLDAAGEAISHLLPDEPAPRQREHAADRAAVLDGLMGKIAGDGDDGEHSGEFVPYAERERSITAAGEYFATLLGGDEGEDATDRSTLG